MPRQKQPGQGSSCAEVFGELASLCVYTRTPSSSKDKTMSTRKINGAHLVVLILIQLQMSTALKP